jgi:plasmid stabilization system protein ParE
MAYLVRLTSRAQRDLSDLFQEIQAERVEAAFDWYVRLRDAILSLEEHVGARLSAERARSDTSSTAANPTFIG